MDLFEDEGDVFEVEKILDMRTSDVIDSFISLIF